MSTPQAWPFVAHIEFRVEDVTAQPRDGEAFETQLVVMRLQYRNGNTDTMILDPEAYQAILAFAETELMENRLDGGDTDAKDE